MGRADTEVGMVWTQRQHCTADTEVDTRATLAVQQWEEAAVLQPSPPPQAARTASALVVVAASSETLAVGLPVLTHWTPKCCLCVHTMPVLTHWTPQEEEQEQKTEEGEKEKEVEEETEWASKEEG
jgi:hypothetical protein